MNLQETEMKVNKAFIAQQKKLLEVKPYIDALNNATTHLKQRQDKLTKALQTYEYVHKEMLSREQKEERLRISDQKVSMLTTQLDTLYTRKQVYEAFYQLEKKEQIHKKREQDAITTLQKEQRNLQQAMTLRDEIQSKIKELRLQVQQKSGKEETFKSMEQAHFLYQKQKAAAKDLAILEQKRIEIKNEVEKQNIEYATIVKQHEVMYRQFLDNSALQLAQLLKDQEPCPVCGSIHHPQPYTLASEYIDVMTLKQLQEQMDMKKLGLDEALRILQGEDVRKEALCKQVQELQEEIQTILHRPFHMQEYEQAKQEVLLLRNLEKEIDILQQRYDKGNIIVQEKEIAVHQLEASYQVVLLDKKELETELRNCKAQFLDGITTFDELMKETKEKTTQVETVKKELDDLRKYIQELLVSYEKSKEDVRTCQDEAKRAVQQEQEAKEILSMQCHERMMNLEDLAHLQSITKTQALEESVLAYDVACVQVATTLHNIEDKLRDAIVLDLHVIQDDVKQLEEQNAACSTNLAQLQSTRKLYEDMQKNIRTIQAELEEEEPAYLKLQQFVRAMRGDNGIGIERYVLGVMLSSITQSANQLLHHVHQGRYQIYRSDEASGRTRKYGLELSIYDSYTCSYRSVVSLSGGEKFLVSLALSLALSTVVQARNGGIHLDAMFIDEGFGTLDEHSIADALQVLQSMSSQKGMVGIISHVELLKENIAAGIEVVKTRQGSRLTIRKG